MSELPPEQEAWIEQLNSRAMKYQEDGLAGYDAVEQAASDFSRRTGRQRFQAERPGRERHGGQRLPGVRNPGRDAGELLDRRGPAEP